MIVSGQRKGTGSSRETAPQCELWSGIRLVIAASFAPIHERNNINLGQLMGDHAMLERLQAGESIPLSEFTDRYDPVTRLILESGGLFAFAERLSAGDVNVPALPLERRPMTMAEKIVARNLVGQVEGTCVKPHDPVIARVHGGYSHEFTTAQVHTFLSEQYGRDYKLPSPDRFAVFEDHLLYAHHNPKFVPFMKKVQTLRDLQVAFNVIRESATTPLWTPCLRASVIRWPARTSSTWVTSSRPRTRTPAWVGRRDALTYGVGATEYANLIYHGFTFVKVPESIRFELTGGSIPAAQPRM